MRQTPSGPENEWSEKGRPGLPGIQPPTGLRVTSGPACLELAWAGGTGGSVFLLSRTLEETRLLIMYQGHISTYWKLFSRMSYSRAALFPLALKSRIQGFESSELSVRQHSCFASAPPAFTHSSLGSSSPSSHSSLSSSLFCLHCFSPASVCCSQPCWASSMACFPLSPLLCGQQSFKPKSALISPSLQQLPTALTCNTPP